LIVQLSDPHLRVGPADAGSAAALAAAVERVLALPQAPDAVLVSGDIAETGADAEYERARELLGPLPMPVHLIAGNHDRFPDRTAYAVRCGELRLVACDTSIPGRDDGSLDVEWLAARLAENPQAPTIVAMHHPPVPIGIPWLDVIGLQERAALAGLLATAPQVRAVVAGHVHRAAIGRLAGVPVLTCASTNFQSTLDFGARSMDVTNEPPSFLVHALVDGELLTHVQPV
jgi:3',5'-cyclic AMP phosphodiesterase CpdA